MSEQLHALLIGVNAYFPDHLPDGSSYPSLQGATRDVSRMALLLRDQAGLKAENTRMLLSRAGEDGGPAGLPEQRPTYANIVAAFKQLAIEAEPGDRVYIQYSGHGARTPTEYPDIKGRTGQDESLVPCDIGDSGSRYLRDLELTSLMRLLVDRGLVVTLVLDCCHAGGAMRGGATASRGIGGAVPRRVPWSPREPVPSAVADSQALMELWMSQQRERRNYRGLTLQSSLPVARYSLFAACRPDELAFEYPFDDREPQGALTYWLLDTLQRSSGELTCSEIHQRLVARIRGFFASQTPMFLGDGERGFLAARGARTRDAATDSPRVLRVDEETGQVLVNVGLPVGTKAGDRIRLNGLAELAIRRVGATESWAEVIRVLGPGAIQPGARAELFRLQTSVRLVPPERASSEAERALACLRDSLQRSSGGFVETSENGTAPDLCVTVDENGAYQILDPGGTPYENLGTLRITALGVIPKLLRRLDHLAKFRNILRVENPRPAEWLRIGLEIEDGPEGTRIELPSRAVDLSTGESLSIQIVNRSSVRLDFAVFDLAPDYSVTQLLPKRGSFTLLPLDPGERLPVYIRGWLPPGFDEGNDVLKVFATRGAANFRWLELPALDRPATISNLRGEPKNPLERLFAQLTANRPAKRGPLVVSEFPEEEWITAQMEVRVRR